MRLSFVEALCLVAIGATMVELHDTRRLAQPGAAALAARGPAAKPAAGGIPWIESSSNIPNLGNR